MIANKILITFIIRGMLLALFGMDGWQLNHNLTLLPSVLKVSEKRVDELDFM